MKTFFRLLGLLKPFWVEILSSIFFGLCTVVAGIGLLGTSAYLISAAALHPSIADLQVAIVGVRFFGISRAAFRYGERLVSHSVNLRLVSSLRSWFFEKIQSGDVNKIVVFKSGDLLDRVLHNLETLENFYVRVISPYIVFLVITTCASIFLGHYRAAFGWILFIGLIVCGIVLPFFALVLTRRPSKIAQQRYSEYSSSIVETLDGLEELTAFGSNRLILEDIIRKSEKLSRANNAISFRLNVSNGFSLLFANLTILGILYMGIPLVHGDVISGIILAVVIQVAAASFEATNTLPTAAQQLTQSITAANHLFAIEETSLRNKTLSDFPSIDKPRSIKVENLSYRAPDGGFSLDGISFDLNRGKKIAIVGPSGAGKTSLVELFLKLIQPDNGKIFIDGIETIKIPAEEIRKHIGVLGTDDYLFNSSLKENLLLAKPEAPDSELISSLEKVGLSDWYKALPNGLNSWLGNHGASVSGGEYQRLMMARIFLRNCPILLLDEPFVHLDSSIKKELYEMVSTHFSESGILWVSHEYLFMEKMDEILYIEDGRIVERGTHTSLVAMRGKYAAAYKLQG
jgi:ATP-binding cassette subfamily C protein CydC